MHDDPNVPYEMMAVIKKIVDDATGKYETYSEVPYSFPSSLLIYVMFFIIPSVNILSNPPLSYPILHPLLFSLFSFLPPILPLPSSLSHSHCLLSSLSLPLSLILSFSPSFPFSLTYFFFLFQFLRSCPLSRRISYAALHV